MRHNLFLDIRGRGRAASVLAKPFAAVHKALGLRKKITPRAIRRTFQDLARAAEITNVVTRSISGHHTEAMQEHYSSPGQTEQRAGLAKVVDLADAREAMQRPDARRGVKAPQNDERPAGGSLATGRIL